MTASVESSPHILVACHAWYGDVLGGSFRLASEFAEHLAASGYRVTYACCAKSSDWDGPLDEIINGVRVVRYKPATSAGGRFGRLKYHLREIGKLVQRINAEARVTHLSGHSPLQALGAAKALRRTVDYFNYTVHSPFDDELISNCGEHPKLPQRIGSWMAGRVDNKNCKIADRVQCDSQYTLSVMTRKHGKPVKLKGIVAPGWVDASQFSPAANRLELRKTLGPDWQTESPIFFTLRRLENRMGLETLIRASEALTKQGLQFRTLIGGGGSLMKPLQSMIDEAGLSDSIKLLGRLPEEQLAACYAAADCFVLPTKALECFGLIVLEAFACNTPVIASNVAAIPELAERQGIDWMFAPGDWSQLAGRMESMLRGKLRPTKDLRALALEYDKPKVLTAWQDLMRLERS